jgi:hypothetical protein
MEEQGKLPTLLSMLAEKKTFLEKVPKNEDRI